MSDLRQGREHSLRSDTIAGEKLEDWASGVEQVSFVCAAIAAMIAMMMMMMSNDDDDDDSTHLDVQGPCGELHCSEQHQAPSMMAARPHVMSLPFHHATRVPSHAPTPPRVATTFSTL